MNAVSSNVTSVQRKGQDSRSAETRDKLLDATYCILRDLGHAGLRLAKVSEKSDVSRGGLLHHYPTKELLIAAVFERITNRMERASMERIAAAGDEQLLEEIVADARARFLDESYRILLDILVASGKERSLMQDRSALAARDHLPARRAWAQRLASTGIDAETAERITALLWNTVKGLAVRNLVHTDQALCDRVIALSLVLAHRRCARARR